MSLIIAILAFVLCCAIGAVMFALAMIVRPRGVQNNPADLPWIHEDVCVVAPQKEPHP